MGFTDDIQGQNTQLYPIIKIGNTNATGSMPDEGQFKYYSTNNTIIKEQYGINEEDHNKVYCKPLLINIPSIKESIDIESRKFKTSNVSIKLNNFPFEGERFSDQLYQNSLINTEVEIWIKSPSTSEIPVNTLSQFYTDGVPQGLQSFLDSKDFLHRAYRGIVRRLTHNEETVTIELEDLTEKEASKTLPSSIMPSTDDIPDKFRNKPIPMVYGEVYGSPVVAGSQYLKFYADSNPIQQFVTQDSGYTDKNDNNLFLDSFQVSLGGDMYHIKKQDQYTEYPEFAEIHFLPLVGTKLVDTYEDEDSESLGSIPITCNKISIPSVTISNTAHDPEMSNEDFLLPNYSSSSISGITSNSPNSIGFRGQRLKDYGFTDGGQSSGAESLLLSILFDSTPNHSTFENSGNDILGFKINGYNLPKLLNYQILKVNHVSGLEGETGDNTPVSGSYDEPVTYNVIYHSDSNHGDIIQEVIGFETWGSAINTALDEASYLAGVALADIKVLFYHYGALRDLPQAVLTAFVLFRGGLKNSLAIEFRTIGNVKYLGTADEPAESYLNRYVEVTGDMHGAGFFVENQALNVLSSDLFANVRGRINTFNDHPISELTDLYYLGASELVDYILNYGVYDQLSSNLQSIITTFQSQGIMTPNDAIALRNFINHQGLYIPNEEIIENPIDIIYDLVRKELGNENINIKDYLEARENHPDWKFAFTVSEKIDSKKLIEDIAKSTKCFPRFKNDGTFTFNTIKDAYTAPLPTPDGTSDYEKAFLIKESEIISYSFSKSKPEQIYSKVDLKYNKSYIDGNYLSTTPQIPSDVQNFYGIEESYLEFESDYIREDTTANKLLGFLVNYYRNNHLILQLKLPVKYINLEVGKLLKLEELIGGVRAYGIDYTVVDTVNNQYYYPLFMITSVSKNLDSVDIECIQLHHLTGNNLDDEWDDIKREDLDPLTITPFIPLLEGEVLGEDLWDDDHPPFPITRGGGTAIVEGDEIVFDNYEGYLMGASPALAGTGVVEEGKTYRYEFEITEFNGDSVYQGFKISPESPTYYTSVGKYSVDIVKIPVPLASGIEEDQLRLYFNYFTGKMKNNISVREVIQEASPFDGGLIVDDDNAWTLPTGASQGEAYVEDNVLIYNNAYVSGAASLKYLHTEELNSNETYRVRFEIFDWVEGSFKISLRHQLTPAATGDGIYEFYINPSVAGLNYSYTYTGGNPTYYPDIRGTFKVKNLSIHKVENDESVLVSRNRFKIDELLQEQELYSEDNKYDLKYLKDME